MQHASMGFKNARWDGSDSESVKKRGKSSFDWFRWVEEGYQLDSEQLNQWHFKIENTRHQSWDCEFYHISKLKPMMLH